MGKVRFNDNTEIVVAVKEGLKRKWGISFISGSKTGTSDASNEDRPCRIREAT